MLEVAVKDQDKVMAAAAPTSHAEVTTTPPHATISKDGVGRKSEALAPVKLSITPEAFSVKFFEANEEKPGLERVSYVVTPHPSKGQMLQKT